jgi:hypothetical protein
MEIIKILRLITGEDIICYTERYQDEIIVRSPMEVYTKINSKTGNEILSLNNWLPFSILKNNETTIKVRDILCTMEPSSDLNEYYENAISTMDKTMDDVSNTSASDEAEMKSQMLKAFLQNLDPKEFGTIQ